MRGLFVALLFMGLALKGAGDTDPLKSPPDPKRGYEALTTQSFNAALWNRETVDQVWKQWGLKEKPQDFEQQFMERYGLHPAPFPNQGLPMGLRATKTLLGRPGVTNDCMICHGGSILGKSYIGLGNASLEIEALFDDLFGFGGRQRKALFAFTNVRGTNEAAAMAIFLFSLRDSDLKLRTAPLDLGLQDNLCEDVPPWWHMRKKKTMYHDGSTPTDSVRSMMQFTLGPLATLPSIQAMEPTFRDIHAFLKTIEPPKYPLAVDQVKAARGRVLFNQNCASCHGTYGHDGQYPNKIIDLAEIGTDSVRATAITERARDHYLSTWFGQEKDADGQKLHYRLTRGYQAPPLDGIWATAPYFHNGSVPTVYHVLHSPSRPKVFTRSYRTHLEDYDPLRLGWKHTDVLLPIDPHLPAIERRKIYDTSQPGRGNGGHTFGDDLTDEERWAIIEYLKTL